MHYWFFDLAVKILSDVGFKFLAEILVVVTFAVFFFANSLVNLRNSCPLLLIRDRAEFL